MDRWLDATVAPDASMSEASASAPLPQSAAIVRPISMIAVIVRVLADAGPTAACRRSGVSRVRTPSDASAARDRLRLRCARGSARRLERCGRRRARGREIAAARANLYAWACRAYGDRMEAAIELAGRVVTEEIVGAQVGRHAPQTEGEIAGGRDRNAISLFGHHVKRRAALGEARSFFLRPQHRVLSDTRDGDDVIVERHDAARIDGIERDVGAIGLIEDLPEA